MLECGPLNLKKQKKRVSSVTLPCAVAMAHGKVTVWAGLEQDFAVCQNLAHGKVTILRRVPAVPAHDEAWSFAVCLLSGHTAKYGALPCVHGAGTWRTAADAVNWP